MEQLGKELEARQARKVDAVLPVNNIRYIGGNQIAVKDDEGSVKSFRLTGTGWKQLLRENNIPADFFLETMLEKEKYEIFNRLVSLNEGKRMLRFDNQTMYACVSQSYKPIDNISVLDAISTAPSPMVLLNGSSSFYDHSKFKFTDASYVDDIQRGRHIPVCEILNSENGLGSFRVAAGIYTIICTNGMIIPLPNSEIFKSKFYHKGNKVVQFPNIREVLNFSQTMVVKMEKAEKIYMSSDDKVQVVNRALSAGIAHETINNIISIANAHYRNGRTLADTIGAVTQTAQMFIDDEANKRTVLEEFAGQLLKAA